MPAPVVAAVTVVALVLAGCAAAACKPVAVRVAGKEQRTRLQSEFRGVTTDPLGHVVEQRRDVPVHEFWVRDADGGWHQVPEDAWRHVGVGEALELCP